MKTLCTSLLIALVSTSSTVLAEDGDASALNPVTKTSQTIHRAADGSVASVVRNTETVVYRSEKVSETFTPGSNGVLTVTSRSTVTRDASGRSITERETLDKARGKLVLRSRSTQTLGDNGSNIRVEEALDAETGRLVLKKRVITTRDEQGNTIVTDEVRGKDGQMTITRQVHNDGHYLPYVR